MFSDYSIEFSEKYLALDAAAIEQVENKAIQDCSEGRKECSPEQLGAYLVRSGILGADIIRDIIYELHMDYDLRYQVERARITEERRNRWENAPVQKSVNDFY